MQARDNLKDKPLISIITVVYNGEAFLEETILSVINQSYKNIEYIIIDGSSSDGTVDIIKKYEEKIAYWVSEKDSGIYDAMNKGIEQSAGDIIGIVNADDYLYLESIEKLVECFEDSELMFTYGEVDLMDEKKNIIGKVRSLGRENLKYKLFKHMPYLHPTLFIRKEVYEELGLYSLEYKLSADYDYTLKLAKSEFKNIRLTFSTGVFRLGGKSGGVESFKENYAVLKNHGLNIFLISLNSFILYCKMYLRIFLKRS